MGRKEKSVDYFSWDNLSKLSGVDEHLSFVQGIVEKYCDAGNENESSAKSFGQDWSVIRRQIDRIRKKKDDKKLNISVIGEFSTGKSTFINALLGQELLFSSALQGTTTASTVIDYSDCFEIELEYPGDCLAEKIRCDSLRSLREEVGRFTTSAAAKELKTVRIFLPADILKNEIRIIDTPGTNVTEAWHEDVTVRAIREQSDLSIVLTSAEKPVPDTMLRFVRKHLEAILPQCVFVVTKIDLVAERERERQLAYIRMKLEEELEIREPVVLPYVSPMVLCSRESAEKNAAENPDIRIEEALLAMSAETERKLLAHTSKQRMLAVTKKLTELIDDVYQSVFGRMNRISKEYEDRLAMLERSQKADLTLFIRKEKGNRLQHYDDETKKLLDAVEPILYNEIEEARTGILGRMDSIGTIDGLNSYISGSLNNVCKQKGEDIVSNTDGCCKMVRDIFQEEMDTFHASFQDIYKELNIIPIDMSGAQYSVMEAVVERKADISATANYVAGAQSSENKAYGGSLAAGAAIGTVICPGIGTVIGAFLGIIGGGVFGPSVDRVRAESKAKLEPQLRNYFNSVSETVISSVEKYIKQIRRCLSNEIDEYLKRYRSEVDRQMEAENNRRFDIHAQLQTLQTDITGIRNHKKRLDSVMVQLNKLGRKEN